MKKLKLSTSLEKFRAAIESSAIPCIRIKTHKKKCTVYQSKFGGHPFFPKKGMRYPKNSDGNHMRLLAQINFREVPKNDFLPSTGMLQFYISTDVLYGKVHDGTRSDFKTLFFRDIDSIETVSDFSHLVFNEDPDEIYFPVEREYGLKFTSDLDFVSPSDSRFATYFKNDLSTKLHGQYLTAINDGGHKLGGYGFFIQEDPRAYMERFQDYVLLLQIDSEDEIMWGDSGSAQFLIDKKDLANHDFSKIFYFWSCF